MIVSHRCSEHGFEDAVNAILAQSYQEVEILVLKDESDQPCSCDSHLEAYLRYTGSSLRLGEPTAEDVVVVADDHEEQKGDLVSSGTE